MRRLRKECGIFSRPPSFCAILPCAQHAFFDDADVPGLFFLIISGSGKKSMNIQELAEQVKSVALLRGDFILSSGRRSTYYLDKYRIETQPGVLGKVAEGLAEKIPAGTDLLAGPELGAIPLVTAVGLRTGIPFLLVRKKAKDYGTKKVVEGVFTEGQRVVLIEDVLTTGTQAIVAADSLRELGLDVVKLVCVIDREEGAREAVEAAGYVFDPLLTRTMMGI